MQGRRILLLRILLLLFPVGLTFTAQANNLVISNVSLTGQNTAEDYCYIRFDISWDNSWRNTSSAPNNWDAAWIFAKYRIGSGTWNHVMLNTTGNLAPDGSTLQVPADEVGAFFYRSADGSGTFSKTGVKLRWNYGEQGIGDDDEVDIKVFGLEMVYVPQGAFWVGSTTGGSEVARFYSYPDQNTAYFIENENVILVGTETGNLFYGTPGSPNSNIGDQSGPIPAAFPKGYNAFYVMKTEITHQQYVDFLNLLTRVQQNIRTQADLGTNITSVTNRYVMVNTDAGSSGSVTPERRSSIRCDAVITANVPVTFYCDLNANGIPNETDDGQSISCVYLKWADVMAYLDWSGLRPMTELEFEKSCRGPVAPVANEYAWGNTSITSASGLNNEGSHSEISSINTANNTAGSGIIGPTRGGMYARTSSNRRDSGATYYGILDMSGNLWERPVTVGNSAGRSFTGLHGNGTILTTGFADVSNWPDADGTGSGFRAGYWASNTQVLRVADRSDGAHGVERRRERFGGRGVRTASTN